MIGLILCSHSELAGGMKKSAEMILGPQENFEAVGFYNGDNLEDLQEKITGHADAFAKQGLTPCVLVDLLGASPFNASLSGLLSSVAYVITGMNLPLVLEILLSRDNLADDKIGEFFQNAVDGAKEGMILFDMQQLEP